MASMPSAAARRSGRAREGLRRLVRVLFALAAMGVFLGTAVDPFATDRDPGHTHVVLGGTALERARALAAHLRTGHGPVRLSAHAVGDVAWHGPPKTAHHDCESRVVVLSVRSGPSSGASLSGVASGALLSFAGVDLPCPSITARCQPARDVRRAGIMPRVPDPPPRPA